MSEIEIAGESNETLQKLSPLEEFEFRWFGRTYGDLDYRAAIAKILRRWY
jgi:hypothetical protein